MILSPRMPRWIFALVFGLVLLLVSATMASSALVQAATPAKSDPESCTHVANAGGIEVYYCEDLNLFVNQLGFMAFEP